MMKCSNVNMMLKDYGTSLATISCMLLIALLISACAGENRKQIPTLSNETSLAAETAIADNTAQTSEIGSAGKPATNEDEELICRMRTVTGSRFKHRICATKAQWAKLENKDQEDTDEFKREMGKRDGLNSGTGSDSMGGETIGVPR